MSHHQCRLVKYSKSGDYVEVNLEHHTVNLVITDKELDQRRAQVQEVITTDQTPWQEIYRSRVNQLEDGAVLETKGEYLKMHDTHGILRNSH